MLQLRKMTPDDQHPVSRLSVRPDQIPFVGTIDELLSAPAHRQPYLICCDDRVVGFFHIDADYANEYEFAAARDVGLRAFFIAEAEQGNGFGRRAIEQLQSLISRDYPQAAAVVLTVNTRNPAAYHIYTQHGFRDTGALYHGGAAGPQHILRMAVSDTADNPAES